jgi:hypothetical protein
MTIRKIKNMIQWRAYWRYIFDDGPLLPECIVTTAFEKIGAFGLH